ncbi:serine/threonine-protein kinase [Phenylobacterium montanum]|uniref:Serine/threonine protein kinase n=1 Tax=Phenylobacterium montanum TaxID=2823693 RepID=A0A975G1C1_9CAUL|nr:serine/threonine-protein kinase [Caulobacter sp. S6]QUD89080.1 serine/threonine protein kinase [Caulobacter sp. S6]
MPQSTTPDARTGSDAAAIASLRPTSASGVSERRSEPQGRVTVGSVLNHIYQVRRFLAQGGMGEVYEGVNINTDERVAIKVILPHLAQDPKIDAMFRKEARTLTRLTHPALVQYRVLAQEPDLGVLYIVTEFVDGDGLDELIGEFLPSEAELRALTRRLADGLRAAHELGAVHRDISPDNILLPGGKLEAAKIIDFGIAQDGSTPQGTLLGEAFAGKLGYVAPEQLGDFGREVGPWTDVYSLGLVILALAAGGSLDMGLTPAEAVDRRRAGPDLSPLPEELRAVFQRMLEPDPQRRLRSMDQVINALDGTLPQAPALPASPPARTSRSALIGATVGALGILAAFGLGATSLMSWLARRPPPPASAPTIAPEAVLDSALRSASCAWLNDRMSRGADGLHIELSGAAGDPAAAAGQLTQAMEKAGAHVAATDHSLVHALPPTACAAVTAFARLHATSSEATWLRPQANLFHLLPDPICQNDPHQGVAVLNLRAPPPGPGEDVSLLRLDETGAVSPVFTSLADFKAKAATSRPRGYKFEDLGPQGLRISLCEKTRGLKGMLVIHGKPPFDLVGLRPGPAPSASAQAISPDWIASAGKAQGWRTQMAWYEVEQGYLPTQAPAKATTKRPPHLKLPTVRQINPPPPAPRPDRHDTLGTDFK